MARIRTVKPSYFSDAKVCRLSIEAQLLFVGIWCFADSAGLLWDDPDQIQMDVFPSRPHVKVGALLDELLLSGMLVQLETTAGRRVLWVKNFGEHQRIHNEAMSVIAPSLCDPCVVIGSNREQSGDNATERKGKEGKGRERTRAPSGVSPTWTPTEQDLLWAKTNHGNINAARETERFLNWAVANGRKFKDWSRAWHNWILKAEEYQPLMIGSGNGSGHRSQNQINADIAARRMGLNPADTDPFGTAPNEPRRLL